MITDNRYQEILADRTRRSLNEWAAEMQALAESNGFRENIADPRSLGAVAVYVANFHGEASELWEAARAGKLHDLCDKAEKMRAAGIQPLTCAEEELADMVIRVLDIANVFGVDVDAAIEDGFGKEFVSSLRLPASSSIEDIATTINAYHDAAGAVDSVVVAFADRDMKVCVGVLLAIAFHIAIVLEVDWYDAMVRKHEFNKTRPHRHGGKLV